MAGSRGVATTGDHKPPPIGTALNWPAYEIRPNELPPGSPLPAGDPILVTVKMAIQIVELGIPLKVRNPLTTGPILGAGLPHPMPMHLGQTGAVLVPLVGRRLSIRRNRDSHRNLDQPIRQPGDNPPPQTVDCRSFAFDGRPRFQRMPTPELGQTR